MNWLEPQLGDEEEIRDENEDLALADSGYLPPDIETDEQQLAEQTFNRLAERVPGWEAHDGNQEARLIEALTPLLAELRALQRDVPAAVLITHAVEVLGQHIRQPAPAIATSRWTAAGEEGGEVRAGWEITVARSATDHVGFVTLEPAIIPPGERTVEVPVVATVEGAAGNGVTGLAEPSDPQAWIERVELIDVSHNGDDGQDQQEFLDGLRGLYQVVGLTPIRAEHFAILTRWFWGGRAVAMDLYDPDAGTWGNWLHETIIVGDEQGEPWGGALKQRMHSWFLEHTYPGFRIHIIDFPREDVDISAAVVPFAGQEPEAVRGACEGALARTINGATWRLGTTSPSIVAGEIILPPESGFEAGRRGIWRNDLIGVLDRCRGVDRVAPGGLLINGQDADLQLSTPYTLPRLGDVQITVEDA